jgi:hypothetical protein
MNKSEDPNAPKNQQIAHAPHGGHNLNGDLVADSTESAGQGSDWEASSDLDSSAEDTAPRAEQADDEGYSSGPDSFALLPGAG